jgi:predicted peptidase
MAKKVLFYLVVWWSGILLFPSCTSNKAAFQQKKFVSTQGELVYNIFYPENYHMKNSGLFPLLIFLHGAGERGNDNISQLKHIAPILLEKENRKKYPAILLFPQCPENDYWAPVKRFEWSFSENAGPTAPMQRLTELVDILLSDPKVDKSRVYISGLSMGGFGTFDYLSRKPHLFAGAVAICGGADTTAVKNFVNIPLWIFHGAKDPVVPVALSRDIVQKLLELGGNPQYTEYPEGGHDIWNEVYQNPQTLHWLFAQKKSTDK